MSRSAHRVELAAGFVLHRRAYRDTSLIVELFTRDYGRLSVDRWLVAGNGFARFRRSIVLCAGRHPLTDQGKLFGG